MLKSMGIFTNQKSARVEAKLSLTATLAKAEEGDASAQFSLGLYYSTIQGDRPDYAKAAHWYRLAADQHHTLAQFNLGMMYERGQGMPHEEESALYWIRKSAEGGDAGGQHQLGLRCHRASLNPTSSDRAEHRIEAYKWLQLASAQNYSDSLTSCQRLILTMSQVEVDEGNRRIQSFEISTSSTSKQTS